MADVTIGPVVDKAATASYLHDIAKSFSRERQVALALELGMSLEEYYSSGENVARGQLAMRKRYGYDNVWGLSYVGKEAELLGGEVTFVEDGPPNVTGFVIESSEDIHSLEIPDDLMSLPAFEDTRTCMRILRDEVGGEYPICAYLSSSMTLVSKPCWLPHSTASSESLVGVRILTDIWQRSLALQTPCPIACHFLTRACMSEDDWMDSLSRRGSRFSFSVFNSV